jgi:hypothetical protein
MKSSQLLISQCHANCPKCKIETDFQMFESGAGGEFETYIGESTGNIYRLSMHKVHYLKFTMDELLALAVAAEGSALYLRNVPDQVKCKVCKSVFRATSIAISGDTTVNAIEL